MIISTSEELRAFLPNHVLDELTSMAGFFDNSEHDFLAERIGEPLLKAVNECYASFGYDELTTIIPSVPSAVDPTPWSLLISLCQRCIVFDGFSRAADINAVSVNNAGLNVVDTNGYDVAPEKIIANFKSQLNKEAHAAANRLLIQLERWQKDSAAWTEESEDRDEDILKIVSLWKQSEYYYFVDGLLLNTATDFNQYVDIYNSREKFIQLVPDIRYCQEVQIENEIGFELLTNLIEKHKKGELSACESKAYNMLRRTLACLVEARNAMFKRKEAKDEASGHAKLTLDFIRKHQRCFDEDAMKLSPLYDPMAWRSAEPESAPHDCHAHTPHPNHHHPHHCNPCGTDGMLISSII